MMYNNFMKLTLKNKKNAATALELLKTRLTAGFECDRTYRRNASMLMHDDLELSGKTITLCEDSGCYIPEDAIDVQIELLEYLAHAISGEAFTCEFYNDCDYSASQVIAEFENCVLKIQSIYYPDGNYEACDDDDLIEECEKIIEETVLTIE